MLGAEPKPDASALWLWHTPSGPVFPLRLLLAPLPFSRHSCPALCDATDCRFPVLHSSRRSCELMSTESTVPSTTSSPVTPFSSCPGGSDGEESACSAGDLDSIPGSGRSPGGGNGSLLQCSCLESAMDRGAWRAAVHGVANSREIIGFPVNLSK